MKILKIFLFSLLTSSSFAAGGTHVIQGDNVSLGFITGTSSATIQSLTLGTTNYGTFSSSGTIAFNYTLGNTGSVILTSSCTINGPTNPVDGGSFIIKVKQDGAGSRTVILASGAGNFAFGTGITSFTASTAASAVDYIGSIYDATKNRWNVVAVQQGF